MNTTNGMERAKAELDARLDALAAADRAVSEARWAYEHEKVEAVLDAALRDARLVLVTNRGVRDMIADMDEDERALVRSRIIADGSLINMLASARRSVRPELAAMRDKGGSRTGMPVPESGAKPGAAAPDIADEPGTGGPVCLDPDAFPDEDPEETVGAGGPVLGAEDQDDGELLLSDFARGT